MQPCNRLPEGRPLRRTVGGIERLVPLAIAGLSWSKNVNAACGFLNRAMSEFDARQMSLALASVLAGNRAAKLEYGPAALNDPDQDDDDRQNKKNMDKSPQGVGGHEPQ